MITLGALCDVNYEGPLYQHARPILIRIMVLRRWLEGVMFIDFRYPCKSLEIENMLCPRALQGYLTYKKT